MLAGGGKVRKLASRGERTISFCLYRRWCRSLHTQASNTSGDFTYTHTEDSDETDNTCLQHLSVWIAAHLATANMHNAFFFYYNDIISLSVSHLEMINVLLCIQVYASGSFLYGHDRQANVYTAMQLSFLNLTQAWRIRLIL